MHSFSLLTRSLRRLLPLALLPALLLHAAAQSDVAEQPQFNVTLRTLALKQDASKYTYISGGQIRDFPLPYDAVSHSFNYTGPSPMLVFRGRPDMEQDLHSQAVGRIALSAAMRETILICATDARDFSYLPLNADASALPVGSFCFVNATAAPVGGLLDQERLVIQPGQFSVVTEDNFSEKRVPIRMAHQVDDQWEMFYSSSWSIPGNKRVFIIVYNDPGSDKPSIRGANLR